MTLYIVSGFSQAGKTTLVSLLMKDNKIARILTCTSRKPRPGEKDEVDFYFLGEKDFQDKTKFIETAIVHGNYYGTSREEIENKLKNNEKVIWVLDVQGTENILKNHKNIDNEIVTIFLTTDKLSIITNRIKTKNDPNLTRRIDDIKKEINYLPLYNYIINTSKGIQESFDDLKAIIYNDREKIKKIEEFTKKFNKNKFLES